MDGEAAAAYEDDEEEYASNGKDDDIRGNAMDVDCFIDAMFPGEFTQEESDIVRALLDDIEWDSQCANYPYAAVRNAAVRTRLERTKKRIGPHHLAVLANANGLAETDGRIGSDGYDAILQAVRAAAAELKGVYPCQNVAV